MYATEQLRQLTLSIVDSSKPAASLRSHVAEVAGILEQARSWRPARAESVSAGGTHTQDGLALPPDLAISCADDCTRTVQFLRGTHAAIGSVRSRFPDRIVRVLYAGCGPYATLAIPLMTIFAPSEAVFTLLDIHAESTNSAGSILAALDLAASVSAIETADAGTYQIKAEQKPDIILMEMFQAALEVEPQIAVSRHLVAQAPKAIVLPEEIRINLVLADPAVEFSADVAQESARQKSCDSITDATAFVVNRQTIGSWSNIGGTRLPGAIMCMPDTIDRRFQAMFFTHVRVFGEFVIDAYESGLTSPRIAAIDHAPTPDGTVHIHYELGRYPGLKGRVTAANAGA